MTLLYKHPNCINGPNDSLSVKFPDPMKKNINQWSQLQSECEIPNQKTHGFVGTGPSEKKVVGPC